MTKSFWAFAIMLVSICGAQAQQITVYSNGTLAVGDSRQLTAYVPLSPNAVTWSVNGVVGGDATYGTVSPTGLYQTPATIPPANAVSVRATSIAYPAKSDAITLTITQPVVQLWSIAPKSVAAGNFTITLNGSNFRADSVVKFGGAALTTTFVSSTSLRATGVATAAQVSSNVAVTVVNPGLGGTTSPAVNLKITAPVATPTPPPQPTPTPTPVVMPTPMPSPTPSPGPTPTPRPTATPTPTPSPTPAPGGGTSQGTVDLAAGRLLEQAAFGPTPTELAHVKAIGVNAWLDEQFALPESAISNPGGMSMSTVQSQYMNRLSQAPDQLRQRVAYALSEIIVISANKNIYPDEIVPYLQILSRNAFGNYRTLLGEISVSSQMGKYLDLANSNKPSAGSAANENYARELMQLFTIGLYYLNLDGSRQLDAQGNPIRAYDQSTVQQVALALTGWTFPGPANNNWENFSGPLQPREINHDTTAKTFVGLTLPAGQTAAADMAGTLDWLFNHQNVGPFIATRLIRALVKSNPTPVYIARIATVFNNNGAGVRGDLSAVIRAILTDSEARDDVATSTSGRLKDPLYHTTAFVRALGGSISPTNGEAWNFSRMSQTPLAPASVFGFYSPLFRIPRSPLNGPEFQIYGPTEAVLRGNLFWQILSNPGADFPLDITPFVNLAGNTVTLIDAVDQRLLYGRMPDAMRQSLANAINAQGDNVSKARTALYLTSLSGFYAIQY